MKGCLPSRAHSSGSPVIESSRVLTGTPHCRCTCPTAILSATVCAVLDPSHWRDFPIEVIAWRRIKACASVRIGTRLSAGERGSRNEDGRAQHPLVRHSSRLRASPKLKCGPKVSLSEEKEVAFRRRRAVECTSGSDCGSEIVRVDIRRPFSGRSRCCYVET